MKKFLAAGVAFIALGSAAHASVTASAAIFTQLAPTGTTVTSISLIGLSSQSHSEILGNGYLITIETDIGQGLVKGMDSTHHAIPVAGLSTTNQASYLSGDYGSEQNTNDEAAGNYFSTGYGKITLTFLAPQTSLALLWGSVDAGNLLTFNDVAQDTLSGAQVQALAAGFKQDGDQGSGGSVYVTVATDTPFTSVVLSSSVMSFEAAAVAGGTNFSVQPETIKTSEIAVPEPATLALVGGAMVWLGLMRRRTSLQR